MIIDRALLQEADAIVACKIILRTNIMPLCVAWDETWHEKRHELPMNTGRGRNACAQTELGGKDSINVL